MPTGEGHQVDRVIGYPLMGYAYPIEGNRDRVSLAEVLPGYPDTLLGVSIGSTGNRLWRVPGYLWVARARNPLLGHPGGRLRKGVR